ncbi:MAG: hypothetical protein CME06_11480 [Gemmatimonadetes bacterium]|nr:hypothetical protein [Gemmatimonadota bacterium]
MLSNVYFLGAGFSKGLGFPLATELFACMEGHRSLLLEETGFYDPHMEWIRALQQDGIYRYREALEGKLGVEDWFTHIDKLHKDNAPKTDAERFEFGRRWEVRNTSQNIKYLMAHLLGKLVYHLSGSAHPRSYYDFLEAIGSRAALITTNWDVAVERILAAIGRRYTYGDGDGLPLMKLHGSANWFDLRGFKIFPHDRQVCPLPATLQDAESFLVADTRTGEMRVVRTTVAGLGKSSFLPHEIRGYIQCDDNPYAPTGFSEGFIAANPEAGGKMTAPILDTMLYLPWMEKHAPDFQPFRYIFQRTRELLAEADRVWFVGYSMPPQDANIVSLLRQLSQDNPRASIYVVNPDAALAGHFESLLDAKVTLVTEYTEGWIESGVWRG